MRRLLCGLLLCGLGLGMGNVSFAAKKKPVRKKPVPAEIFKKKDKDGNGTLSLDEYVSHKASDDPAKTESSKKAFAAKDKDGDGKLTLEEFKADTTNLKN